MNILQGLFTAVANTKSPSKLSYKSECEDTALNPMSTDVDTSSHSAVSTAAEQKHAVSTADRPEIAEVIIDPHGDVILIVPTKNNQLVRFRVNASVLSVASPVFQSILQRDLTPRPAETRTPTPQEPSKSEQYPHELQLDEFDPDALAIVLRILHFQYTLVPARLGYDYEKLYQVAIFCDKYELHGPIRPWFDKWISAVWPPPRPSSIKSSKALPARAGWLFIAYVFNHTELMSKLFISFLWNMVEDEKGLPAISEEYRKLPDALLGEISRYRRLIILGVICIIDAYLERYSDPTMVKCKHKQMYCDALVLGLLHQRFGHMKKLYPTKDSGRDCVYTESLAKLETLVSTVYFPEYMPIPDHNKECCTDPKRKVLQKKGKSWVCAECGHDSSFLPIVDHCAGCSPIDGLKLKVKQFMHRAKSDFLAHYGGKDPHDVSDTDRWHSIKYRTSE